MISTPNQPHTTSPIRQSVPSAYPSHTVSKEEFDLLNLWRTLMHEKLLIIILTVLCTAGAIYLALTMQPIYRAEVLLEPMTDKDKQNGGLLAQYGGLAAMTGIKFGGGDNAKKSNIAKLKSRTFIKKFLNDKKIMPILFYETWDPTTNSWQVDNPKQIPTMWDGVEYFSKILHVNDDKRTGLVTLALEWHDREKIAHWANLLVEQINSHLQKRAIQDTEKNIKFLKAELKNTTIVELRSSIITIMEGQIKKIMLVRARTDFAFKVIDPAVVPPANRFVKPKRRLLIVLGFTVGGFLGIFSALFRNFLRR